LRVGVVGTGAVAQVAHLSAISKLDDAKVVGLCDIDVPKAQALARRFDVPDVFDDIEDLLSIAKPDAVVICTPNHLHEVHTVTALDAGVHVLCERPLALNAGGVERVKEVYERGDRVLLVGMNHRYRRDVRTIREFMKGGELGDVHAIRAGWYIHRPGSLATGWRERAAESGGGAMFDLGLPLVDVSLWIAGLPQVERVSATFSPHGAAIEDSASAYLYCAGGLSVFIDVSWRHIGPKEKVWFEVMGNQGSAKIGRLEVYKEMHGQPIDVTPARVDPFDAFTESYRAEWQAFQRLIRGEANRPVLDNQLRLHQLMDTIRQSAGEGRELTL
jgi:predicted dehydrogenase